MCCTHRQQCRCRYRCWHQRRSRGRQRRRLRRRGQGRRGSPCQLARSPSWRESQPPKPAQQVPEAVRGCQYEQQVVFDTVEMRVWCTPFQGERSVINQCGQNHCFRAWLRNALGNVCYNMALLTLTKGVCILMYAARLEMWRKKRQLESTSVSTRELKSLRE